jgi:hypothetical protein
VTYERRARDLGGGAAGYGGPAAGKIGGTTRVQALGGGIPVSGPGRSAGAGVLQLKSDPDAGQQGPAPAPGPVPAQPADKAVMQQLDALPMPNFAGLRDGAFAIDAVTRWMTAFAALLDEAKANAVGNPTVELTRSVERGITALGVAAGLIRDAAVQMTNDSSVAKQDPAKAIPPSAAEVRQFAAAAADLEELSRAAGLPTTAAGKAALSSAATTAQDAALAMLQSLSVLSARERWKKGAATETPSNANAGRGPRVEVDEIFKDSAGGFGDRASVDTAKGRVFDWCGMFVAASYAKGASMQQRLRAGFNDVANVKDYFQYTQKTNAQRTPLSIWAEGAWWTLHDYHQTRSSLRKWTPRAALATALAAGTADIRPGDTCLIDHGGGDAPGHIVMVESYDAATGQLVTIEGNTWGIMPDATGKAARGNDGQLAAARAAGATTTGIHVRDLSQLAPQPGTYKVVDQFAYVRVPEDLTKVKMVNGEKLKIPTVEVEVTELKTVGKDIFANVKDHGWTAFSNLANPAAPAGAYQAIRGATVFGVGRPSLVDFEDHEYAVHAVPAALRNVSPADIRKLANGTAGAIGLG